MWFNGATNERKLCVTTQGRQFNLYGQLCIVSNRVIGIISLLIMVKENPAMHPIAIFGSKIYIQSSCMLIFVFLTVYSLS